MQLTSKNVNDLFEEATMNLGMLPATVEGVLHKALLNVEGMEIKIAHMLDQLPDEFKTTGGGGWSFLQACMTVDGDQWTGLHMDMEKLVMLGIAAGKVKWSMPKEFWPSLPGGMPYFVIDTGVKENASVSA